MKLLYYLFDGKQIKIQIGVAIIYAEEKNFKMEKETE